MSGFKFEHLSLVYRVFGLCIIITEWNIFLMFFFQSFIMLRMLRLTLFCVSEKGQTPEEQLKENFVRLNFKIDAFNSLHYIGENCSGGETDFKRLKEAIFGELRNNGVRSPRQPKIILDMLEVNGLT